MCTEVLVCSQCYMRDFCAAEKQSLHKSPSKFPIPIYSAVVIWIQSSNNVGPAGDFYNWGTTTFVPRGKPEVQTCDKPLTGAQTTLVMSPIPAVIQHPKRFSHPDHPSAGTRRVPPGLRPRARWLWQDPEGRGGQHDRPDGRGAPGVRNDSTHAG